MRKLMAMETMDGVACYETGLCSMCDTPENRRSMEQRTWRGDPGVVWSSTQNHAISCQVCGRGNRRVA